MKIRVKRRKGMQKTENLIWGKDLHGKVDRKRPRNVEERKRWHTTIHTLQKQMKNNIHFRFISYVHRPDIYVQQSNVRSNETLPLLHGDTLCTSQFFLWIAVKPMEKKTYSHFVFIYYCLYYAHSNSCLSNGHLHHQNNSKYRK